MDLDMLVARPLEDLLIEIETTLNKQLQTYDNKTDMHIVAFGEEPAAHSKLFNLTRIVGNAFIVSTARHPFWRHMFAGLRQATRFYDYVIEATGPFLLTRVVHAVLDAKIDGQGLSILSIHALLSLLTYDITD